MLWWDWTGAQKLRLLAGMLVLAATPWLLLGWIQQDWRAFLGGTAFLLMPQIIGWLLFVGLKTGHMPLRGGTAESRTASPIWFWIIAALYGGLLAFLLGIIVLVAGNIAGLS